jgi:NTE family protein
MTALVLGAGGVAARAFHAGVLRALVEVCDWDPRLADLIIGTSAGAQIGALLRAGVDASALYARVVADPLSTDPTRPVATSHVGRRWPASLAYLRALLRRPWRARPIRLVAALLPEGALMKSVSASECAQLFADGWPARPLWITAVDLDDGARVVFGSAGAPATDLATAVCCSSAIPGLVRPVYVGRRRYIDGAVASATHLDLVGPEMATLAVVLSPLSRFRAMRLRLHADRFWMARRGVRALVFEPDASVVEAMGWNPFDVRVAAPVARAAYVETVRRLAGRDGQSVCALLAAARPATRWTAAATPATSR